MTFPSQFDGGGGRGHHAKCFSMVLAGGGLKTGQAIGTSDELGMSPVTDPISIPDFHATIHPASARIRPRSSTTAPAPCRSPTAAR